MECPYCNITWEGEERQYCPQCGKLVSIFVRKPHLMITIEQIIWIIVAGFSSYLVLFYIIEKIKLPLSIELYLGLDASIIMSYRVYLLFRKSNNESLGDFFPYYKEFFILAGLLIWFSAFWIKLIINYVVVDKAINFAFLGVFTIHFFEGYILGLLLVFYFFYRSNKARRVNNVKIIDLFHEEKTKF